MMGEGVTTQWFRDTIARGWSPQLPRTGGFAGVGGVVREAPEDFRVEELPAYLPSGQGNHLYLRVTKREMTTPALAGQVARVFGISENDVGTAGLKDRNAVTTQWLSVNLEAARGRDVDAALAELAGDGRLRIDEVSRHTNKLKTGHLTGNRFVIVIRDVAAERIDAAALDALVARLTATGLPNYYGSQRFGRDLDNVPRGLAMLDGRERASGGLRRMLISAVQSALFNAVTATRVSLGIHARVFAGDVLMRVESGGCFVCRDADADQARLDAGELVVAAPLPGPELLAASGLPGGLEAALEARIGLEASPRESHASLGEVEAAWPGVPWLEGDAGPRPERRVSLRGAGKLARGARRAMMIRPSELGWRRIAAGDGDAEGLELRFVLEAGSYATTVLHEFMGSTAGGISGMRG